jgi:hypothetical protein
MFFKSFVNTYPGISVKLIIVLFTTLKARAFVPGGHKYLLTSPKCLPLKSSPKKYST